MKLRGNLYNNVVLQGTGCPRKNVYTFKLIPTLWNHFLVGHPLYIIVFSDTEDSSDDYSDTSGDESTISVSKEEKITRI